MRPSPKDGGVLHKFKSMDGDHVHDGLLFFNVLTHDGFLQKYHGSVHWLRDRIVGMALILSIFIVC